ncbi:DUF5687 family protein [Bacteroides sp. 519]|uniref:DUF5687 family protein n=1 Tax=Bacteroides sp. 519 TaxID=2302937 RepID=UPI0013D166F3|nr:DUF5687 family protein [Bacteroides sp. 519]NDV59183.1 hypothetical protein [Bacteroides sp. 519]
MLFNELRKQGKLANKRHPMYEKNKFGKIFGYFMAIFWLGYLIFFGTFFAFAMDGGAIEAYDLLNKGLMIFLVLDFLIRFPFQKTPTQEMKPYLLLPIKRNRLLDFLLLRSGMSGFNCLWLFLFVPFALFTVTRYYWFTGVFTYCLGIYLLMLFNNYWYLLCRTLLSEKIWWILLPIAVYAVLGVVEFTLGNPISTFSMHLGSAFISGNLLAHLGVIAAIACMWFINRWVMSGLVYSEVNRVEDTKVKNVSEYKFLERYGEIGEYFRLELKMLFRNKRCKSSLRSIAIVVVLFSCILSFTEAYDGNFMRSFIAVYSFVAFGTVLLTQIMGFEGNYLDGLMTRKESIYNLLRAKYYFYSILVLVPFVLLIPAMIMGKIALLTAAALTFFTTGFVYCMLFQLAVYNNKTVPLNEGITGRQASGTGFQSLVASAAFGVPMLFYFSLNALCGEVIGQWILMAIGIGFTFTAHLWIKNIYNRFMKRRYVNMEGFRDTK